MFTKLKFPFCLSLFFLQTLVWGEQITYSEVLKPCLKEQVLAVDEVLDAFCQTGQAKSELRFTKLHGGMTRACIYSFELHENKYVLRFLDPKHPPHQRTNEIYVSKLAGTLKLGPYCVVSDCNALVMIMPFIEGHALTHADLDITNICALGKMIRCLHNYQGDYPTRFTLLERLKTHYQKAINAGVAYPSGFKESVETLQEIPRDLWRPCHGDFNPSNILLSGNDIYLIDWANATWDDPFSDLSCISFLTNMSEEQECAFLRAYLGREPSQMDYDRLKHVQNKSCLITAAIWLRCAETPEDKKIPLQERVTRLDAELCSPTLKSAQDYLREGKVVNLQTDSKEAIRAYGLAFYKEYLCRTKKS